MAIPDFLTSTFGYSVRRLSTDVQQAIDDFRTLAVGLGWTNPGAAGRFVSPPDAVGRFIDITFSRIDAKRLELTTVLDQNGVSLIPAAGARRIKGPTTLSAWDHQVFAGQFHFCINISPWIPSDASLYQEALIGGILDLTPEAQNAHAKVCWWSGPRNNADVNQGNGPTNCVMLDNATVAFNPRNINKNRQGTLVYPHITGNSYVHASPVEMCVIPVGGAAGQLRYAGRLYQAMNVSVNVGYAQKIILPLDATTLGTFQTVGVTSGISELVALRIA